MANEITLNGIVYVPKDALCNKVIEIEPFNRPVIVGRGAIVDATEWIHNLNLKQK